VDEQNEPLAGAPYAYQGTCMNVQSATALCGIGPPNDVQCSKREPQPNKRVQSDAAAAGGIGANFGYVTRLEWKPISGKSRRG
jgi:hypothetical protein